MRHKVKISNNKRVSEKNYYTPNRFSLISLIHLHHLFNNYYVVYFGQLLFHISKNKWDLQLS